MAHLVSTNAFVTINGVDLSDHVKSVKSNYSAEMLDNTTMGDTTRKRLGGLKDWEFDFEMLNDYAASEVDATLFPLVGTTFTIEVRPVNASRSATNPGYTGTGILENYPIMDGSIGEVAPASFKVLAAGTLSRSTS